MLKTLILSYVLTTVAATHYITKVNETVHHNVILDPTKPWDPEMYAKKVILRKLTGSITSETFSLVPEVEELYFVHSSIEFIHPEAFKVLPKLKILQFSYNTHLPFLTNEILKNCRSLKKITIGHNKFVEGISEILFSNLQNLTHIEVTRESKFPRKLTQDFFKNSRVLGSIKLHFSNITSIDSDAFEGLDRLNFLSLAENELVQIGPRAFRNKNLVHLYLGWNKLNSFTGKELFDLQNLSHLDISFNPLSEVNLDQIRKNAPKLRSFSVAKTTLTCTEKKKLFKQAGLLFHVHMDQSELSKCEA